MAQTQSKVQLPIGAIPQAGEERAQAFERGLQLGRAYADYALRRVAAWAEENPGQLLLAGLAAGFALGKLLHPRPGHLEEAED